MSLTRKYSDFLSKGFKKIGKFTISPWTWATEGFQEADETGSMANDVVATGICLACGCAVCCCRSPFACAASLVTFPLGGTTALVFGVVGVTAYPVTLAIDGVSACCGAVKDHHESSTKIASEKQTSELPKTSDDVVKTPDKETEIQETGNNMKLGM